jgi:hypothetical protein
VPFELRFSSVYVAEMLATLELPEISPPQLTLPPEYAIDSVMVEIVVQNGCIPDDPAAAATTPVVCAVPNRHRQHNTAAMSLLRFFTLLSP